MIKLNDFGDCASSILGTGSGTCDLKSFGDPRGITLFDKGWFLNIATGTFNEAAYKAKVKSLSAFPLLELFNFEQSTPENETNTSSTGVLTEIRAGKPQFSFIYDKGGCFHKALYDKRGKSRWDLAILFDEGVLLASNVGDTEILGFDMGALIVETFKLVQGTDPQTSTAMIQLLDAAQFNERHRFLPWTSLGFNMNRVAGVIECSVTYPSTPTAGNTVVVKVAGSCNTGEVFPGLDDVAQWRLGGVQESATTISSVAFDSSLGEYTLTVDVPFVAGDTIRPELYDTSGGFTVVEDAIGAMYKGVAPLTTIG